MQKYSLALLLPLLTGCIDLAKDYPERHLHAIAAERPGDSVDGPKGAILAVKPFTINSRYEGAEFVYRKSETTWESDYYEAFFVPPREMITDASRSWIARAGIFGSVTGMSSSVPSTHILEGHVAQLWIDSRAMPLKAVVEVQVMVADESQSPAKIVLTKSYGESVTMKEDTPEEAVQAWDAGLRAVLERLEADLRGMVGGR
ncbi:MAG: hypothetical protein AAB074_21545 [Planctomycetota bacterium]